MTRRWRAIRMASLLPACLACAAATGGAGDAPAAWTPERPEFERVAARLDASKNPYLGHGVADELRQELAAGGLAPRDEVDRRVKLTQAHLRFGELDAALEQVNLALSMVDPAERTSGRAALLGLRALVHLRRAEVSNCVRHRDPDACIFPLKKGGLHLEREPAESARRDYIAVLEIEPENLEARWLLNIVHMALGEYPEGVAPRHLLPPAAFASEQDIGRFPNVAPRLGLDTFGQAGGVIVEDFDEDGFLDIVSSTFDPHGPMHYFRSRGDGTFEDVAHASRLDDQLGGLDCLAADYDNDGRRDVLVLRGAWLHDDGQIRSSLLHNDRGGTFTDVTRRAGLADPPAPTQAAAWGDYDNDGDLDLYVCNESRVEFESGRGSFPSRLFQNRGDGTFTDVAREAGVTNDRFCKGLAAGDYDDDGDLDLYVSNIGDNRLYRNGGDGTFTDVAVQVGVVAPRGRSFATWFFDYDNDGRLDIFVAGYEAKTADLAAVALGLPERAERPRLYHNEGGGSFSDRTREAGLDHVYLPMGANFGDLDNDGFLDIYLGTGDPLYQSLMPNVMLRNDGGRRFVDVTQSGGFGHLQKGHGIGFADLDHDGDQDIYHELGGFYAGDKSRAVLFENPGHGQRFLRIDLEGTRTNRDAMGARIRVVVEGPAGRTREIHRAVGSVSSFGGSPIRQELGLGRTTRIQRVEVGWPTSRTRSVIEDAPLDATIRIVEGRPGFERVESRRFVLGGARPAP